MLPLLEFLQSPHSHSSSICRKVRYIKWHLTTFKIMHISRRESHFQRCDVTTVRGELDSSVETDDQCSARTRPVPFTTHRNQNPWQRIRKTVGVLFARSHRKHAQYTSLKPAVKFCVGDHDAKDLFKKDKKKNCARVILNENNEEPIDYSSEDDWEEHDFTLRKRSASYDRRRMAICKEIEKNTKLGCVNSTSLLELRKTLVINNRFMEMGLA